MHPALVGCEIKDLDAGFPDKKRGAFLLPSGVADFHTHIHVLPRLPVDLLVRKSGRVGHSGLSCRTHLIFT